VHFAWVGNCNEQIETWLLSDLEQSGLEGRFHMVGHVEDPIPFYEAADVFLLSSREDPFPTVVLEAFRAGIPVVAMDGCGGFVDIVRDHGSLVDRGDIAAMAAAVESYLDRSPDERREHAEQLIQLIDQRFQFDDYMHDLLKLLLPQIAKVSVVVPNYNYARFLPQRLETVFDQTHPLFETLVLDDKSTDNSLEVLRDYAAQRRRVLRTVANEVNSGSGYKQWDKGAGLARGDFVWIAEADDQAKPEFLDEALALMRDGNVAFVFCDSAQIDEHGRRLGESYRPYFDKVEAGAFARSFVMGGAEFARRFLAVRNLVLNVSGVLWRREALERALAATRDGHGTLRLASDWLMYVVAATECGDVGFVAKSLNVHRRHSQSVTHALAAEKHIAEIAAVHAFVEDRLGADERTQRETEAYLAELREQFGLGPAASAGAPVEPGELENGSACTSEASEDDVLALQEDAGQTLDGEDHARDELRG
jgi:Glycosyl transferase family 2/Glycosyl transferases group 1